MRLMKVREGTKMLVALLTVPIGAAAFVTVIGTPRARGYAAHYHS